MANWAVDPAPHVPCGFSLVERMLGPPRHHEVFMTGCHSLHNEDLVIIKLQPAVNKDDYSELAEALRSFFLDIHQVRVVEVQPCPLGTLMSISIVPLKEKGSLVQSSVLGITR